MESFQRESSLLESSILEELRDKYFDDDFIRFHTPSKLSRKSNFDMLPGFLGQMERKGINPDFVKKVGILLLSETDNDGVKFGHFESLLKEWLTYCKEGFKDSLELRDNDFEAVFDLMLNRYQDLKNFAARSSGELILNGDIVRMLGAVSNVVEIQGLIHDNLLDLVGCANILDRRSFLNSLPDLPNSDFAIDLLADLFGQMDVDETVDMSTLFDYGRVLGGLKIHLSEVGAEKSAQFWLAFRDYCDKRVVAGYTDTLRELVVEKILETDDGLGIAVPEEVSSWLYQDKVEKIIVSHFDVKTFWGELVKDTSIEKVYESLLNNSYEERFSQVKKYLPKESVFVWQFVAQIMGVGLPSGDEVDTWDTWTHKIGFDWEELLKTEPVQKIWERIRTNPQELAYQLGFWLANFPVKSLSELGIQKVDLVEGVKLDAGQSSLCGYADIYMAESLNMNKVRVKYDGKLLFKKIGNEGALCTEDFEIIENGGERRVFKRGCFYMPVNGIDSDRWQFARPLGGDQIPKAAKDVLHLADRWLVKHGYKNKQ